uniref:Sigma-54-dependent Fis family transcriptional regulator n=1 Tax=candidate division WOR-3 bacterium TaxID=2052148 RepID=A0A7V0Z795_UNCW3
MKKYKILVVDDEEIMRSSLSDWLKENGYEAMAVEDGYKAIEEVKREDYDLAIVDLKMPGMDGIETMKRINNIKSGLPVIIITAYATIETAVLAVKEGAADYIVKPFNPEEINLLINKILEHQRVLKENLLLRQELTKRFKFQDLIGKSPKILKVFEMIKTVAPTKSTVLIRGESGTGKELIARAIHELSPRHNGPFIAVACGAMPETLLEAELFGYEKGAFTGATSQYKGRIEMADKGTLFLDEIGDISLKTQVDLLRVIQEREFRRLGGKATMKVDIRIIAATNKNLEEMIAKSEFREDLYYRLNVITLWVPPLRDRKEDIPLLVEHFLTKYNLENRRNVERISPEVMRILIDYPWPGNVRELENTIEHSVVVAKGNEICIDDLPPNIIKNRLDIGLEKPRMSLTDMERVHIINVLRENNWNVKRAAMALGINRVTLYNKIKKHKIKKDG